MLQEFGMNLDLELDQGSGHDLTWHLLFVCCVLLYVQIIKVVESWWKTSPQPSLISWCRF